jgi:Subunit 11 of the general transcription factor TFIIH
MPAFPFTTLIFRSLTKLDLAFVALLQPQGPSSTGSDSLSTTDKVRIKSLIEGTRVAAVNCASSAGHSASIQDLTSDDDSDSDGGEGLLPEHGSPMNEEALGMALAKVYKRSLEILGDSLADVLA